MQALAKAEATDDVWGDALGVPNSLIDGEVAGKIGFMDALEATEEGAQGGERPHRRCSELRACRHRRRPGLTPWPNDRR